MRQDVAVREVVLESTAACWHCGAPVPSGLPTLEVLQDDGMHYYVAIDHGAVMSPPLPPAPFREERFA